MRFLSGFESTHIFGSGKDVLQTTNHTELYEQDLRLASACGLKMMRYSAPWHFIERSEGVYDWSWMDAAMNCLKNLQIDPVLDPLHHTSFPAWLTDGFADERFVDAYVRFVRKLANRYPWVKHFTIINEPFVTAFFCGHEGIWHPYRRGGENFVTMVLKVSEAICRVSLMLTEINSQVQLIHVDSCEKHRATDSTSVSITEFRNELRFLIHDLILGKISCEHPLYSYLKKHGASEERLEWFRENTARIDVLGLNYYAHSELEWSQKGTVRIFPNQQPEGFAVVAEDYAERYHLPIMLSETNIRGTIYERISWLKFMVEQCEALKINLDARGIPFLGFCWYPFIDSTDWCSLVREANGNVDPQGIFSLDANCRRRYSSELSEIFGALASGKMKSEDIPAYRFHKNLDDTLQNFLPLMNQWKWRENPPPIKCFNS